MAFSNLLPLSIMSWRRRRCTPPARTDIQTSAQAAEALRPIAGAFAEVIFALGIVGTGLWPFRCSRVQPLTPSARDADGPWGSRASRKRRRRSIQC